jgi:hypothetical protein
MATKIDKLTPQQEAQVPVYVAKYIAKGFKVLPYKSTDRLKAVQSIKDIIKAASVYEGKSFVHLDHVQDFDFKFIDAHKHFKPGDIETIKKVGKKTWEHQDFNTLYLITGVFPDMKKVAENWTGSSDVKDATEFAQHASHAAVLADFASNVLNWKEQEDKVSALINYVDNVGVILRFDNCIFVCDHPTGHIHSTDKVQALWTDVQAQEAGISYD